ncbi:DUF4407 domain-containing protein [Actinoplanes sp. NPDC051470]|uniref:DUF4407 domain-containing protein n=1 Tax=Actinoplanes sp. NPDC051470 TaxID=3157224 RepID=UPI0034466F92
MITPGLLLGWLGGGQPAVLRESPADAARYSSMGVVLVGTAVMASLSATFALMTAVKLPIGAAVVVGVFWGLLILGLDRMLVISMSKQQGFWRGLLTALPRLGLALLIGTVISVPLVLRVFEPELNNELQVIHNENLRANQEKLNARFADIATDQAKVDELQPVANGQSSPRVSADPDVKAAQAAVDKAQAVYDKAAANAQCELTGDTDGICTGKAGKGPAYREAKAEADRAETQLRKATAERDRITAAADARIGGGAANARKAAAAELTTLVPRLEKRKADRQQAQQDLDRSEAENTGLLVRLEALERLSDGHPTMWLAHLALAALFAAIELLPVLAKLLSGRKQTLYDLLVAKREAHALALEDTYRAQRDQLAALTAEAREELERHRLELQTEAGKRAHELLAEKSEAIARRSIDVWGQVAEKRTEDELARWYRQHTRGAAATQNFPLNGQTPGAVPHPAAPAAGS